MFSYHSHVWRGEITGATPDGRRRSTAFSDGIGPSQGRDGAGATCLANSVTRLDHSRLTGGCAFNLKVSPELAAGPRGRKALAAFLRAYFRKGGSQIQINLVDQKRLSEAQRKPELHHDVIVRVAGFSEYFVSLDRKLQDEIIRRTSQQLGPVRG
jgi:formate C-acetyltransferase